MLTSKPFFTKLNLPFISQLLHFTTSPALLGTNFRNTLPPEQISQAFKEWFKSGHKPVFNQIFYILMSHKHSEDASLDSSLSRLNLKLSESFVLEILNYHSNYFHGNSKKLNLSTPSTDSVLCCLRFFEWAARQANFQHTRATFHAIFRILSQDKLMDFLDKYTQERYMYNVRFHDVLVMGYSVAGKPEIALQLFSRMRFNGIDLDRFAYHVLLNALVKEECYDVFDVIVKQIRMRGYEGEITHSIVTKSLVKRNMLDEAEKYLRKLCEQGCTLNKGYVVGALVDGLCKSGRFEDAGRLIDEFGGFGVAEREHAYGVMIRDLVQAGKLDWAMDFFSKKKLLEGYVPHVFKYNLLISSLLRENRLQEVFDLFVEMKELKLLPDKVTMNAALCYFCKAGMVDVAIDLFKSREEFGLYPNTMAYNYLVNTLCGVRKIDVAFDVLMSSSHQKEYFPGNRTLSILADALCRGGKLNEMSSLIRFCIERQIMLEKRTYQNLINSQCNIGKVEDGYTIYEHLNRLNIVPSYRSFISLIEGFLRKQRVDISAKLLIDMQGKGLTPRRRHFRSVISHLCSMDNSEKQYFRLLDKQLSHLTPDCVIFNFFIDGAGHARKPELARQTYEMMTQYDIAPNLSSDILILQSYLKSEQISDAINFFDGIRNRREIRTKLYNTMVVGLCRAGKPEIALEYLKEMKTNSLTPSIQCYETLVERFLVQEKYDMAVNIINILESDRVNVSTFIGNLLLFHSLRGSKLYDVWVSLRDASYETSSKSLLGMLIGTFSGSIEVNPSIEELEEVIGRCFPLDTFTYNMLLEKLHISDIDQACKLFRNMGKKGYEPNIFSYRILQKGLRKNRLFDEARSLAREMEVQQFVASEEDREYV